MINQQSEKVTSDRWMFFSLAALLTVLIIAVFAYFVYTPSGQWLENRVLLEASDQFGDPAILSLVGIPTIVVGILAVIVLAVLQQKYYQAILSLLIVVASNGIGQVLKLFVLKRPFLGQEYTVVVEDLNTFPSGHALAFFSLLTVLVFVLPKWAKIPGSLIVSAVMIWVNYELVAHSWHRFSDLLGSMLLVLICAAAISAFLSRTKLSAYNKARKSRFAGTVFLSWVIFMLSVVAVIVVAAFLDDFVLLVVVQALIALAAVVSFLTVLLLDRDFLNSSAD